MARPKPRHNKAGRGAHRGAPTPKAERAELEVSKIGGRGDGLAFVRDGTPQETPVYVKGALPGETVSADVSGERGVLRDIITPSAKRVSPPCPHFLHCGGCSLQQMAAPDYLSWKQAQVVDTLSRQNIVTQIDPVQEIPAASRRRATFVALRKGKRLVLGFHESRSHDAVDISTCHILVPELVDALPALRDIAQITTPQKTALKLAVLKTDTGLDIDLDLSERDLSNAQETALVNAALTHDFARLTCQGRVIMKLREPILSFGTCTVSPPPGSFIQASQASEAVMAARVLEIIGDARHVVDLFAGCGTFALRASQRARVAAYESEAAALHALQLAHHMAKGLQPLRVVRRDLFDHPLMAKELEKVTAAILNPPRAGAETQTIQLAKSNVPTIAYVSCAPSTFARDARILIDAGYELSRVTPVDQFVYAHHIELIGEFRLRKM